LSSESLPSAARAAHDDEARRAELRGVLAADPALMALLAAARDRYVRSGSWTTKGIALSTPELRGAAAALGIAKPKGRLSLKALGDALHRTRFRCTVEEAVRWAFDAVPATRDEVEAQCAVRWEFQQAELVSLAGTAIQEVLAWLSSRQAKLRRGVSNPALFDEARLAVRAAAAARMLTGPEIVPVLANRLSGDPHALDVGRYARRCFERILLCRHADLGLKTPLRAGSRAALLAASNLAADGISSQVWAVGLMSSDRMLTEARASGHVLGLPLVTLDGIRDVAAYADIAFAVENRSVFAALLPVVVALPAERRPTLICTSGNPSLAARVLLQRLAWGGAQIYYGGDTDVRGVGIARTIELLTAPKYGSWHMHSTSAGVHFQESSILEMEDDLRAVAATREMPSRGCSDATLGEGSSS